MAFFLLFVINLLYGDLVITSDNVKFLSKERKAIFEKDIIIRQDNMAMFCQKVIANFDKKGAIKNIIVPNELLFKTKTYSLKSEKATYSNGSIILKGEKIYFLANDIKGKISGRVDIKRDLMAISGPVLFAFESGKVKTTDASVKVKKNQLESINFPHTVFLLFKETIVRSDEALLFPKDGKFIMSGNVIVLDGSSSISCDKLEMDLKSKKYKLSSSVTGEINAK